MSKENVPMNPEEKAASLVRRLDRREEWLRDIGLGQVQVGLPLEKTVKENGVKKTIIVSDDKIVCKVGEVKSDVKESIRNLARELARIDPSLAEARRYLYKFRGSQINLARTSEAFADGDLTERTLQIESDNFKRFASQAKMPFLENGIERLIQIRQAEKIRKKNAKPSSLTEVPFVEPKIPNRVKLRNKLKEIINLFKNRRDSKKSSATVPSLAANEDLWWHNIQSLTQTERDCLEAYTKASGNFGNAAKELDHRFSEKQVKVFVNSAFAKSERVIKNNAVKK